MKQQNNDLFLIFVLSIINIVWACIPTHTVIVGIVIAFPLIFLAPGYLLVELLMQKQEQDRTKLLLLSLGLSLSIDIFGGFLLNITPMGLTIMTWGIFLSTLTIAWTLLCMMKRRRWRLYGDRRQQKPLDRSIYYKLLLLLLTIGIVAFAFVYTTNSIASQQYQGFTQFWLLLNNRQTHVCVMQIGIANSESTTTTYQIEVKENNQPAVHWSSVTIAPQQKWQGQFSLVTDHTQATQFHIEADLYREQEPGYIYRTVQLFVVSSKTTCIQE
jgi:uncharacterized membrane protein